MRRICFNKFIDDTRKNKYIIETKDINSLESDGKLLPSQETYPETEVIVSEEIRNVQNGCFLAIVRKLALNQRIVFSLVDMYGIKIEPVSDILKISVSAAK